MRSAVQRLDAEDEELFREVLVQLGWPASMQNRVRLVARSQSNICMQRHTRVYSSITSLPVFSRMRSMSSRLGTHFKRVAKLKQRISLQEIAQMHLNSVGRSWDKPPALRTSPDDIDLDLVNGGSIGNPSSRKNGAR